MTNLQWSENYGMFHSHLVNGAVTILVKRFEGQLGQIKDFILTYNPSAYVGKYEVIVGIYFHSRVKGKFFDTADEAMEFAEKLVLVVCKKVVEKLENI